MRALRLILFVLTIAALTAPSGANATGSLKYDPGSSPGQAALGNIREQKLGTRTIAVSYDAAKNRSAGCVCSANGPASPSTNNGGTNRAYSYDARGNATGVAGFTFTYDFANQPTAVSGGASATYAYDGNLKRVKEVRGGKTVYTVYSRVTGGLVYRDQATDVVKTDYVTVGGAALRLKKTGTGAFVPEYTHFDSQGSAVAATNASGQVTWRERYAPFGEELLNPAANNDNTGFTGHLKDDSTGLNYMQARYYDPIIGRFLSTDPIGYQDQLNLYAYVANDPVNAIDPNGEVRVIISGLKIARATFKNGGNFGKALKSEAFDTLDSLSTLADGKVDFNDVLAVVDLATGIDAGDVKGGLKAAENLRNDVAKAVGKDAATVTGGVNTKTGAIAAGRSDGCGNCAENAVSDALGGKKEDVKFTDAIRPRTGEQVPVCATCEANFGRESFSDTAKFKTDELPD